MLGKELLAVIESAMKNHKLDHQRCQLEVYQDFKRFLTYLKKTAHKGEDLLDLEIDWLIRMFHQHWNTIHNTAQSYEQEPTLFPNSVFIAVLDALIENKLINPLYRNTQIKSQYYWMQHTRYDIFMVPAKLGMLTNDQYYYYVPCLLPTLSEQGLHHLPTEENGSLPDNDVILPLNDFHAYYNKCSSTLKKEIVSTCYANLSTKQHQLLLPDRAKLESMANFEVQTFVIDCLQHIQTKHPLDDKTKIFIHLLHQAYQSYSDAYRDSYYMQLDDGHLFTVDMILDNIQADGLHNPYTNQVTVKPEDIFSLYTRVHDNDYPDADQFESAFIDRVLALGVDFVAAATSKDVHKNLAELLLHHAKKTLAANPEPNYLNVHERSLVCALQVLGNNQSTIGYSLDPKFQDITKMAFATGTKRIALNPQDKPSANGLSDESEQKVRFIRSKKAMASRVTLHPVSVDTLLYLQNTKKINQHCVALGLKVGNFLYAHDYFNVNHADKINILKQLPNQPVINAFLQQTDMHIEPTLIDPSRQKNEISALEQLYPASKAKGIVLWRQQTINFTGYDSSLHLLGKLALDFHERNITLSDLDAKIGKLSELELRAAMMANREHRKSQNVK